MAATGFAIGFAVLLAGLLRGGGAAPSTGPATEKRFPPLQVPAGFKAKLFACDPLIEYPSVIAAGPRPGALFVAIDFVTGLGVEIVRRDEIRLVEDTDGDGYADRATVFAKGFNSIQGLAHHDGTMYVMHAPYLTRLRDTKGTGVADERRDLLTGLGLKPEDNPSRLHCANGVVVGRDGWLYLALGDNGCDVPRPEGDRLVLQGGGILRCRPDGRDLHVFATGLRNIYDVALDADLNVFVRDNENDGGTYLIRVCHSFFGADHGYPYLYEDRPDEALPPIGDFGLGSSAGGVCYLGRQFPPEYRGNLFFCEWGRSVVRYPLQRAGSGFAPVKQIEFAAGAANDPYGFHPTDIVVQRDGTMMVSDWADGQRPKRGRGRIYHIAYDKSVSDESENRPDPDVWALARQRGTEALADLLKIASSDRDVSARAQAIRAIADLTDPMLVKHQLDAGRGDAALAERLATLAKGQDKRVVLEIVIALGRLRWAGAPDWLRQNLARPDATLAHAAMQTLRHADNWPAVVKLLDEPSTAPIWPIAVRALAERYEPVVVDGLITRLKTAEPAARRAYADALTRVYKKPVPWKYWGYRPGPRPANSVTWEKTEAIAAALNGALGDPNRDLRLAVLKRMQPEKVTLQLQALREWLHDELQPERTAALLTALRDFPPGEVRPDLVPVIGNPKHATANRLTALDLFAAGLPAPDAGRLGDIAALLEGGPVQATALRHYLKRAGDVSVSALVPYAQSPHAEVRAVAVEGLGDRRTDAARDTVVALLLDKDARVRQAAAGAAGKLGAKAATEVLLKLATEADAGVRRASLASLRLLREPKAVPLAVIALSDHGLELTALECLSELGGPEQTAAVTELARHHPSAEVLAAAVRGLTAWRDKPGATAKEQHALDRAVADIQGASGMIVRWQANESVPADRAPQLVEQFATAGKGGDASGWRTLFAIGTEARVGLAKDTRSLAYADIAVSEPAEVEFLASSSGSLRVWLNAKLLYQRELARTVQVDSDRFAGNLARGLNRLLVEVGPAKASGDFHLRFRRKSSKAEHERLTQAALTRPGSPERGRKLFFDAEKSLCLKCHRVGETGERIGPELTGVGGRFSRIYLVESILEPSRTIAPSFGALLVTLKNGKQLTGVKVAHNETMLSLADNEGKKHLLARADIESEQPSAVSVMPAGLEKRFTEDEFVDLIAFLAGQKDGASRIGKGP
jgi:putative membrane-bound dehydrogenase-like protein